MLVHGLNEEKARPLIWVLSETDNRTPLVYMSCSQILSLLSNALLQKVVWVHVVSSINHLTLHFSVLNINLDKCGVTRVERKRVLRTSCPDTKTNFRLVQGEESSTHKGVVMYTANEWLGETFA